MYGGERLDWRGIDRYIYEIERCEEGGRERDRKIEREGWRDVRRGVKKIERHGEEQ